MLQSEIRFQGFHPQDTGHSTKHVGDRTSTASLRLHSQNISKHLKTPNMKTCCPLPLPGYPQAYWASWTSWGQCSKWMPDKAVQKISSPWALEEFGGIQQEYVPTQVAQKKIRGQPIFQATNIQCCIVFGGCFGVLLICELFWVRFTCILGWSWYLLSFWSKAGSWTKTVPKTSLGGKKLCQFIVLVLVAVHGCSINREKLYAKCRMMKLSFPPLYWKAHFAVSHWKCMSWLSKPCTPSDTTLALWSSNMVAVVVRQHIWQVATPRIIETWFKARYSQHPIVVLRSNDVLGLANLIHFPKRKRNTRNKACTNANKSPSIQSHRPILCPWSEAWACSCPCYQNIRGSETNQQAGFATDTEFPLAK